MKKYVVLSIFSFVFYFLFGGVVQADLSDGLMAYYPFNGNANDESGNGYDGTIIDAFLFTDRAGNAESAYSFNGDTSYITTTFSEPLNNFSVSVWFKVNEGPSTIVDMDGGCEGDYWHMGVSENGNLWVGIRNGGCPNDVTPISIPMQFNNLWHHALYMRNNDILTLYLDGNLQKEITKTFFVFDNDVNFTIGNCAHPDYYQYAKMNGAIDEIYIYNRALFETEIQELYLKGENGVEGYDEGYEAGKQYCIENPEECGIDIGSDYQTGYEQGYIDGEATCEDEAECTQVITYAQVPNADCWVEFSTPCDVPEGWEYVYEKPSNMCGSVDDTLSKKTDNCSTFDIFSNTLHVPCFDGGSTTYWLDLELTGSEPVTFELKDLGTN